MTQVPRRAEWDTVTRQERQRSQLPGRCETCGAPVHLHYVAPFQWEWANTGDDSPHFCDGPA